ncbi:MAG: YggS family pyridoxal phosphate-dependent enzyme [Anaerovoracaceae bacterium]
MNSIEKNLKEVMRRIGESAKAAFRNPEDILLVGVTKTRTAEEINAAIDAGLTDIGENKVQELISKYDFVKPCRWHMIGHLQTNKVKYIVDKVVMIHSVDSTNLASEINKRCKNKKITMDILIQINLGMEEAKGGVSPGEAEPLICEILEKCENVTVKGLMIIPPASEDINVTKGYFRELKQLFDSLQSMGDERLALQYLSMGMSQDYEEAVLEGANIVRVGTSIFGPRNMA